MLTHDLNPRKSKLNIGIVCYPSIGGSGVVATNLGLEFAELGHTVHFIAYEKPFKLKKNPNTVFHKVNVNTYSLFKYPDYTLPLAVEIYKTHLKFNLDILHVHYAVPHATAGFLALEIVKNNSTKKQLPKIITTLHGTDITLIAKDPNLCDVIKYSIEKSSSVSAVSNYLKNQTQKILKTKKTIQTIYNFYNPKKITISKSQIKKSLNIKDDDFIGIHISNLRPVKRIPDLLKTASLIKNPKFKLLIIAGGDFTPFQPLVKKYRLMNAVKIISNPQNIENYINIADVGIFPSEEESFGLSILECMTFQKPIIATKAGGVPEVVEHNQSGFLSKVGDVKNMAKNVKILMQNKKLSKNMGEYGKKIADTKFNNKKIVNEYLSLYLK